MKNPGQFLSMGYGFVEFKEEDGAKEALKTMQHTELDGHVLELKISNRTTARQVLKLIVTQIVSNNFAIFDFVGFLFFLMFIVLQIFTFQIFSLFFVTQLHEVHIHQRSYKSCHLILTFMKQVQAMVSASQVTLNQSTIKMFVIVIFHWKQSLVI